MSLAIHWIGTASEKQSGPLGPEWLWVCRWSHGWLWAQLVSLPDPSQERVCCISLTWGRIRIGSLVSPERSAFYQYVSAASLMTRVVGVGWGLLPLQFCLLPFPKTLSLFPSPLSFPSLPSLLSPSLPQKHVFWSLPPLARPPFQRSRSHTCLLDPTLRPLLGGVLSVSCCCWDPAAPRLVFRRPLLISSRGCVPGSASSGSLFKWSLVEFCLLVLPWVYYGWLYLLLVDLCGSRGCEDALVFRQPSLSYGNRKSERLSSV